MQRTKIEYLDYTWNPLAMRCTKVSPGCKHCWHLRMANRLTGYNSFSPERRAAYSGKGPPVLVEGGPDAPLRPRKPSRVGVQFMGDLFHGAVDAKYIYRVYAVMAAETQHTFVVLTKRPERLLYLDWREPLPNVWLGVSVEDQRTADERIPLLLKIPAAVRWVSYEPALGAVVLDRYLPAQFVCCEQCGNEQAPMGRGVACGVCGYGPMPVGNRGLDWVVCGAETGPGKRPMELDWARSVRDQCRAAGVPFFFKRDSEGRRTIDGRKHEEYPG